MLIVVLTPARFWPLFFVYAAILFGVALSARLSLRRIARRMVIEIPFVIFAVILPFVATGPTIQWGPVAVSSAGLVGATMLLTKSTLGVITAAIIALTTSHTELISALDTLRVPATLVAIVSFMARYTDVVIDDSRRMHKARRARLGRGGAAGSLGAVAAGAGTLFVRTYERGERIQRSMAARCYTGERLPVGLVDAEAIVHEAQTSSTKKS